MVDVIFPWLVAGQLALVLGLAICVWLWPEPVLGSDQGGVSNYALRRRTVVPFSLAFLLCAGCMVLAAVRLPAYYQTFRLLLMLLVILLLLMLATAYVYKRNHWLHETHFWVGGLLVVYQAGLSVWLLTTIGHPPLAYLGFAMQLAGGLVCLLAIRNRLRRLFYGQAVVGIGFAIVLLSCVQPISRAS